jgi:hypothetical protein
MAPSLTACCCVTPWATSSTLYVSLPPCVACVKGPLLPVRRAVVAQEAPAALLRAHRSQLFASLNHHTVHASQLGTHGCVCVPLTTQLLLVPYFSWQRSHGVHHSRTNHITEGETHVPSDAATPDNQALYSAAAALGEGPFTIIRLIVTLVLLAP